MKFMTSKEHLELRVKNREYEQGLKKTRDTKILEENANRDAGINNIYAMREAADKVRREHFKFVQGVKKDLLAECVFTLLDKATGFSFNEAQTDVMKRNLVNNFINENGVDSLLSSMTTKSYVLSEYARIINKYSKIITEKCNKENTDSFCVEPEDRDSFFDELNTEDMSDVAQAIKMRVADSVDQFVQSNIQQKEELKDVLRNSKEKADNARTKEVQESYNMLAKRAMTDIREKKKHNVLESMILAVCESTMRNEDLKKVYTKDGKLDMDTVVENCTVMYAFLETLNTSKMFNVNESYIKDVLKQLKG